MYSSRILARSWDHPRSRGNYCPDCGQAASYKGSPPLARELLSSYPQILKIYRITPARAGTTRHLRGSPGAKRDHPRSRGNYIYKLIICPCLVGSPPLARELQILNNNRSVWAGITPARAGTTFQFLLRPEA